MDEIDRRILAELKKNSRSPIRDLAKTIGLPHSTVHTRIQRMEKKSIIQGYTIRVDDNQIDQGFTAFLLTRSSIPEHILSDFHIKEVSSITGDYESMIKVKFRDFKQFSEWIGVFRKKHPCTVMTSTKKLKE